MLEKSETVQQHNAILSCVLVGNVIIMVLLTTYLCTITDSVGILKCKVREHYSNVCAAREVTECLLFPFLYICVLLIVYFFCVLLSTWRINVFIIIPIAPVS